MLPESTDGACIACGTRLVLEADDEAARVQLGHADERMVRRYSRAAGTHLGAEVAVRHACIRPSRTHGLTLWLPYRPNRRVVDLTGRRAVARPSSVEGKRGDALDPKKLVGIDERFLGICAYCGGAPSTRDHVPSRVLLDEPFPPNLPVVDACEACNASFAEDELYVASFIECVLAGTAESGELRRPKISNRLARYPRLVAELAASRRDGSPLTWEPDRQRVDKVLLKLAQGHAAWELALPALGKPVLAWFAPLAVMEYSRRAAFEMPSSEKPFPELGSRAFHSRIAGKDGFPWKEVQEGRYRYCVDQDSGVTVRFVLSEYLACLATWA